ncbi:hemerythrin domain-containing protein [Arcobacter sp.]|uniref:hemerythrin domain-containing protein n=1 Tax=Arcobacter sp. TaxID=1872629 RepID=UPI003D1000D3
MTIKEYMTQNHKECDEILAQLENAVENNNWNKAIELNEKFKNETLKHFDIEENYLFPMFDEKASTGGCGPTQVMKMEHEQARTVFPKIEESIKEKDSDRFFGLSESLMILIQQHNSKEEQMLYTMIQNLFNDENETIIEALKNYEFN